MVMVCKEKYPRKETDHHNKQDGFYMNEALKEQLDFLVKNITKDWDFTLIICGEGEVRVGKSVLGMQIGAYWSEQIKKVHGIDVPFNHKENFVYDGRNLIKKGNDLGQRHKYSCLIFDEAGADLEGAKTMLTTTRAVRDYLRECGQYNMLTILILPEFFDLPKGVALSRSIAMLNVYYLVDEEGYFKRGYFKFYSRPKKKYLYLNGKKNLDYNAGKYDFYGDFDEFYTINEKEYRDMKAKTLKKRESGSRDRTMVMRNIAWYLLLKHSKLNQTDIARLTTKMGVFVDNTTISLAVKGAILGEDA